MTGRQLLSGLDDDGAPVENVSVKSSPKEVCRYIFRQLAAGDRPPTLRSDLQKRGLSAKVADMYTKLASSRYAPPPPPYPYSYPQLPPSH